MEIDKRTIYSKCKEITDEIKKDTISFMELETLIGTYMSGNPKTIEHHMRLMGMTGLIKDIGNGKFEIIKK